MIKGGGNESTKEIRVPRPTRKNNVNETLKLALQLNHVFQSPVFQICPQKKHWRHPRHHNKDNFLLFANNGAIEIIVCRKGQYSGAADVQKV